MLIAYLLKAYIENITAYLNAPVSMKVYKFYLSLASTSRKSFYYVFENFDDISLQTIHKRESASRKKTPFINHDINMIEDIVFKFL